MKEIEIAANEYQSEYLDTNEQHCSVADHFKAGVEWAKSQRMSEWVSVEDRLPGNLDSVLGCFGKTSVGHFYYDERNKKWYQDGWFDQSQSRTFEITNWQPLPPPPQTSK